MEPKNYMYLIKIWFYEAFPKNHTKDMIKAEILERFEYLDDKVENVEVISLTEERKCKQM